VRACVRACVFKGTYSVLEESDTTGATSRPCVLFVSEEAHFTPSFFTADLQV